ncbi:putative monooxygenase YcnE [Austwickia sp. TVS 96-490-7B]|uniref:putative quinol monooxygenase n=1 Tax=Austwickia sp. TVS 96-490-7B TaxID=2830843 RepID=UPI001C58938B|nr:putative quinol monooxygenase [Austwickia sp. TVS 96-490-7B]MBW3086168.1 putative monooxygenase YcnE [Austwickia sp. TVS 96-490-7B]
MILINVKFAVKPEHADRWADITREFTEATRAEPGNKWFEWSRSLDDPHTFVLLEAFEEGDAPEKHINSPHFQAMRREFPQYLSSTPLIVSCPVPVDDWGPMGEIAVD